MTYLVLVQVYSQNRIYKSWILDRFETTNINLLLFTLGSLYSIGDKNRRRNVACVSTITAFAMFIIAFLCHIFLGFRKFQCLTAAVKFIKQRLQPNSVDFDQCLQTDLIDNADLVIVCSPTLTVVGMSWQHTIIVFI